VPLRLGVVITSNQPSSDLGTHHLIQLIQRRIRFAGFAGSIMSSSRRLKTAKSHICASIYMKYEKQTQFFLKLKKPKHIYPP